MDPHYGSMYRDLYERHWWWRAREKIVLKELVSLNPTRSWGGILDVGCGDGLFFPKLEALGEVQGVEPDASLVSPSSLERWRIHLRPFDSSFQATEAFGLILFLDVLEHLAEPVSALAHAIELLAPGGTVLVTVPAFPLLWTAHDEANHHHCRYTKASFAKVAEAAGMRILRQRFLFHWMFGPKLAVRGLERALGKNEGSSGPTIPPGWVNRVVEGLSLAENAILGPLRIPFGSSLLVVGTKP